MDGTQAITINIPKVQDANKHSPRQVDSKKLEFGFGVMFLLFSFFLLFWDQRTVVFQLSGFYCKL